jgi:hypothetical protein
MMNATPLTQEQASLSPDHRMQTLAVALRHVGGPLLTALLEAAPTEQQANGEVMRQINFAIFPELVESSTQLAQQLSGSIGNGLETTKLRWGAVSVAAQLVAANYKATGQALDKHVSEPLLEIIQALPEKFKSLTTGEPEAAPNQIATFRAKMLEAMIPAVGAISQYSFGRAEHGLLAEVAERLMKTADQITRSLAPPNATPDQWRFLCWVVLRTGGQVYADSHYAESDRLLCMATEERAAYFAKHGSVVPMTLVWQEFNQRMALLATLGAYLEVPPAARMDEEGWT